MKHSISLRLASVLVLGVMIFSANARAEFPTGPIRVVVGFPPGGGVDAVARLVSKGMSDVLGQAVVVENRPGAGGQIGAQAVARAQPDGYTLLVGSPGPITIAPGLFPDLPYRPSTDLTAVSPAVLISTILVAHPSFEANSVAGMLDIARKRPGALAFGSGGMGTALHLAGELVNHMAGTSMLHVPYKGSAPGLTDAMSGQVQLFMADPSAVPYIKAGKLKVLGITATKPSAALPGYPLIADAIPGYEADNWYGFLAPAGTPAAIVAKLNQAITGVLRNQEIRDKLLAMGMEPTTSTPAEFAQFVKRDTEKWGAVIKAANVKPQ